MKVALVVDNPFRDLGGLILVSQALVRQGVTALLVPFNVQAREIWSLAPDFVLLNYLRKNNEAFAGQLVEAGIRIGVLDTEGGVLADLDAYGKTLADDADVRDAVSCVCSWGPRLADHAVAKGWYRRRQVTVTGSPRFDFYAERWRGAAAAAAPHVARYPTPLVLINGNFPVANPRFQSAKKEAKLLVERFGFDREYVARLESGQRETMRGLTRLTSALASRFPHVTFVYRPHPFERLETYHELLTPADNLHVVKQGTVDGWILRACAVIQRGCSTAIEAGLALVPALSPVWIPTGVEMESAESVSVACASQEELEAWLEQAVAGSMKMPAPIRRNLDNVITQWFHRVDGAAHERVALEILRHLPPNGATVDRALCRAHLRGRVGQQPGATKLRDFARAAIGLVPGGVTAWRALTAERLSRRWRHSDKFFDAAVVERLVNAVNSNGDDSWSLDRACLTVRRGDTVALTATPRPGALLS